MIKQIALVTKKPGMSRAAFIDRYENGHAVLALRIVPSWTDYRRNYIIPGSGVALPDSPVAPEPPFDGISEFWFADQSKFDGLVRALQTDVGDQITEDETYLFDRSKITVFMADESVTPAKDLAPVPSGHRGRPAIKMVCLVSKKKGMSRAAFIEQYEKDHAPYALKVLRRNGKPVFAEYRRSFPVEGSPFKLPHIEFDQTLDFDVMTEIWFWTKEDFEVFNALSEQDAIAGPMTENQEQLFDLSSVRMFLVEEHITPEEQLYAHVPARAR